MQKGFFQKNEMTFRRQYGSGSYDWPINLFEPFDTPVVSVPLPTPRPGTAARTLHSPQHMTRPSSLSASTGAAGQDQSHPR